MSTAVTTPKIEDVEIRELPAQDYLGERFRSSLTSVGLDVQAAYARLYSRIEGSRSRPTGPPFLIATPPAGGFIDVEVGAPCTPVPEPAPGQHAGRLEAGRAAILLCRGPYEGIAAAYGQVFRWIGEHALRPAGPPREVYLNGPGDVQSPNEYLTEVVAPIQ